MRERLLQAGQRFLDVAALCEDQILLGTQVQLKLFRIILECGLRVAVRRRVCAVLRARECLRAGYPTEAGSIARSQRQSSRRAETNIRHALLVADKVFGREAPVSWLGLNPLASVLIGTLGPMLAVLSGPCAF